MNRTRLLLVACLASGALLFPTGAVPLLEGGQGDQVSEHLVMAPGDGPNGAYAVLNEDDEIELRLTEGNQRVAADGIDADAVTRIPGVFTITYTGDEYARVWVTDDVADLTFVGGEDAPNSLEGRENAVVLGPNQTIAVGLVVDTRGDTDVESAQEFTVHAELADGERPSVAGGDQQSDPVGTVASPTTDATPTPDPPTAEDTPVVETTDADRTDTTSVPTDTPPETVSGPQDTTTDDGPLTVPPESTDGAPVQVAEAGEESPGIAGVPGTVASGVAALAVLLLLGAWRLVQ